MLDLKKYYGEMKKLTIAELVLNAVTFFCVLFLFVLPCFTASIGYSPDTIKLGRRCVPNFCKATIRKQLSFRFRSWKNSN